VKAKYIFIISKKKLKLITMKTITLIRLSKYHLTLLFWVLIALIQNVNAQISAAQSGDWASESTWTGGVVPGAGDVVVITGHTVTVSTADALAQSVTVETSATVVGKLVVQATGSLTVSNATTPLSIKGGEVENAGSISLTTTGTGTNSCISFSNTNSGMLISSGKYSGAGVLNLNSSTAASGSGISMSQSQTTGTSPNVVYYAGIFSVGGTYNFSIASGRPVFGVGIGRHTIDGSGSMSFGAAESPVSHGLIMVTADFGRLTINPDVTLSIVSNMVVDKRGPVYLHNVANSTLINKGTINIDGTGNNAIASISSGTATLTNEGTININGTYQQSYIGINGSAAANFNIANTGAINIIASGATVPVLGTPHATNSKMVVTNNTHGVLNITAGNDLVLSSSRSGIINAGGTLKAAGILNGNLDASTGTIQPGGDAIGKLTVSQLQSAAVNTNNLSGKLLMDIHGKTTAGTDFDQIAFAQAAVNVAGASIEVVLDGGYSPVFGDNVTLISAVSQTGSFNSAVLPSNSTLDYSSPTTISLIFGTTNAEFNSINDIRIYNNKGSITIENGYDKQLNIFSIEGKKLYSGRIDSNYKSIDIAMGLYVVEIQNNRKKLIVL
jgi:hypothetical protein